MYTIYVHRWNYMLKHCVSDKLLEALATAELQSCRTTVWNQTQSKQIAQPKLTYFKGISNETNN